MDLHTFPLDRQTCFLNFSTCKFIKKVLKGTGTYFDQKQRAFRHLEYAFDMHSSQVG